MAPFDNKRPDTLGNGAGPTPAISYTPTETTIPPQLYSKVPNLDQYKRLKEAERNVDLAVLRKALDFQAIQQKTVHPSNFTHETGVLRVFIYNTCENQPWQKQLHGTQGESSWTLRVEGRFLPDSKGSELSKHKFSSFLNAISIDLLPNDDYVAPNGTVEWRAETPDFARGVAAAGAEAAAFDGIDVKRNGIFNVKTKIALLTKSHAASLRLSEEMAQFCGKPEATQQELVYTVWQYVLFRGLAKLTPGAVPAVSGGESLVSVAAGDDDEDDLTVVVCDEVLKRLLRTETFKFIDLYKLLQPHFRPREPMVVEYEVDTRRSTTLGDVVLDIPVELPANLSNVQKELLEFNKSTFENLTRADAKVATLNLRISLGIVALQSAAAREAFYRDLADDPVRFVERWLESQSETLKALKNDEGYDEELVRRAAYFEENEHLLREKIDLLLASNKL